MGSSDLSIGLSGLLVSQRALQTTGNNIANANTPGYSRQSLSVSAMEPELASFGPIGRGVTIDEITRIKDDLVDSQIRSYSSLLGNAEIKSDTLKNLQLFFNELSDTSLSSKIDKFFQSIQALSMTPEFTSSRNQVLQDGIDLSQTINNLYDQLKQIQDDLGQQIITKVSDINSITSEIAKLNESIVSIGISGGNANDAMDKRDQLIKSLSKLADIRVINGDNNSIDILLSGRMVVNGINSVSITTGTTSSGTTRVNGVANITEGELKGLLDLQDTTLAKYMGYLDTLASSLIKEINKIHSEGVGLSGGFTSLISTNAVSSSSAQLSSSSTGLPFTPSVTTYSTGTVASSFTSGDGYSTVTGTGTAFTSNVSTGDMIELGGSGNFYKVIGVDSDTSLRVEGEITTGAGLATNVTDGNLYINVESSSGGITKTSVAITSSETLSTLATKINNITNLTASVSGNLLTITSASGYMFNFAKALDTNPGSIGNSTATLSGYYTGSDNDVFTFTVTNAGTGSIGTGSAVIRVTDSSGAVLANLDVGSSYTAGDALQIADGVSVSFGSGAIALNNTLRFDVVNDPDTSNVLTALGLNTFFDGKNASTIDVAQYIKDDITRIAAASTSSAGDNTNALRLAELQESTTTSSATFTGFLQSVAAELGLEARQKISEKESYSSLLSNIENRRQEISGVSIEEEMINTVRFQQAFQASARYITVVTELNKMLMDII